MKIANKKLNSDILKEKTSLKYGKAKWIQFAEQLMSEGFDVYLYEAKHTFSKYLTVKKDDKKFKVRFSNHKPGLLKEVTEDSDFFVGISHFGCTTTDDALKAVRNYFGSEICAS